MFFREAKNTTRQENMCVSAHWWKVRLSRTIFEVRSDGESVMRSSWSVVNSGLETVMKKRWPAV